MILLLSCSYFSQLQFYFQVARANVFTDSPLIFHGALLCCGLLYRGAFAPVQKLLVQQVTVSRQESGSGAQLFLSHLTQGHCRVDAFQAHHCPWAQQSRRKTTTRKRNLFDMRFACLGLWLFSCKPKRKAAVGIKFAFLSPSLAPMLPLGNLRMVCFTRGTNGKAAI